MQNCYSDGTVNKSDYKDKRLYKAIISVCSDNVLIDRQIVKSILDSIMSLKEVDQQLSNIS